MLLFRDIGEHCAVCEQVLGVMFVTEDDLLELHKLQFKLFGYQVTCKRIKDSHVLLQSCICTSCVQPPLENDVQFGSCQP